MKNANDLIREIVASVKAGGAPFPAGATMVSNDVHGAIRGTVKTLIDQGLKNKVNSAYRLVKQRPKDHFSDPMNNIGTIVHAAANKYRLQGIQTTFDLWITPNGTYWVGVDEKLQIKKAHMYMNMWASSFFTSSIILEVKSDGNFPASTESDKSQTQSEEELIETINNNNALDFLFLSYAQKPVQKASGFWSLELHLDLTNILKKIQDIIYNPELQQARDFCIYTWTRSPTAQTISYWQEFGLTGLMTPYRSNLL